MKNLLLNFLFISCLLTLSFAKDYKKDFNHTFIVSEGTSIILENGDGDVQFKTWDKNEIAVEITYHASSKYAGEKDIHDFDVEFSQKGDDVFIIAHEFKGNRYGFISFQYLKYNYKIFAPSYVNLEIKSDDGDVEISNIKGDIKFRSNDGSLYMWEINNQITNIRVQDGDIKIEKHSGDINIEADDGEVEIENLISKQVEISVEDGKVKVRNSQADFYVDSDDGNISMLNISGNDLDVRSKDGNIDILFNGIAPIDLYVSTDDGSVDIELKNEVSATFNIETDDGRIRFNSDDSNITRESDHFIKGEFGNGDGKINIRTNDGPVSLSTNF